MKSDLIPTNRLYTDLVHLWPLLSDPADYREEADCWRKIIREKLGDGRHRLFELGSGGGHHTSHLTSDFEITASDLSEMMLQHSRKLNPDVEHHQGDMRNLRLNRKFDGVLIHDAISYMTSEDDLKSTFATAAAHLNKGGLLIVTPDHFFETFKPSRAYTQTKHNTDVALGYIEYDHDPNPDDTMIETIMIYILEQNGSVTVELDKHTMGLFPLATWMRLLDEAGFEAELREFDLMEGTLKYKMLVGVLR